MVAPLGKCNCKLASIVPATAVREDARRSHRNAAPHCTDTVKLTGAPGLTVAVAVHAFGSDSVPSASCAVAAKTCTPDFNASGPLEPVIPVTGPVAPLGAVMENNFTGVGPVRS